ncbi:hypothetical protein TL16_g07204 [Triparma laevis f. inornata]|uniref:Uncharacterized protein n=1 Tax=Triparma laevis f. inornata TaxID=1714386 RepID=A0A9W7AWK7_9STRA|nr:hypothetical protein TL16_g07204 [Triparma laevis f. inornata]
MWHEDPSIRLHLFTPADVRECLHGLEVVIAGDSIARTLYYAPLYFMLEDQHISEQPGVPSYTHAPWKIQIDHTHHSFNHDELYYNVNEKGKFNTKARYFKSLYLDQTFLDLVSLSPADISVPDCVRTQTNQKYQLNETAANKPELCTAAQLGMEMPGSPQFVWDAVFREAFGDNDKLADVFVANVGRWRFRACAQGWGKACSIDDFRNAFQNWLTQFQKYTDGRNLQTKMFWFEATLTPALKPQITAKRSGMTAQDFVDNMNMVASEIFTAHNNRPESLHIEIIPTYTMFEKGFGLGLNYDYFHLKPELAGFSAINLLLNKIC